MHFWLWSRLWKFEISIYYDYLFILIISTYDIVEKTAWFVNSWVDKKEGFFNFKYLKI
jgi:hypothetical protein